MTTSRTEPAGSPELAQFCVDPECLDADGRRTLVEPETDGEHRYWECPGCGYAFGYHRSPPGASDPANNPDTCAVGVPESLRRAFPGPPLPPLLQIGRRDGPPA